MSTAVQSYRSLPRSNRSNSPFRYPGGKFYARRLILDELPPHTFYCEPFAGGASVFFVKEADRNVARHTGHQAVALLLQEPI